MLSFLFGMSWLFWGMVKFGFTNVCLTRCQYWEGEEEKVSHSYNTFQGLTIDNLDPSSFTSIVPHIVHQLVTRKTFPWYMHSVPQTMQQHTALSPLAKWETRKSAHVSHFLSTEGFWYCLFSSVAISLCICGSVKHKQLLLRNQMKRNVAGRI